MSKFIPAAEAHFNALVVPREEKVEISVPLRSASAVSPEARKKKIKVRVSRYAEGGKPYDLCGPLSKLSQFGLGIAMYFYIILILFLCNVLMGFILLPRIAKFVTSNSQNNITDFRVYGTAACPGLREVELDDGDRALLRTDCMFPDKSATWSDFAICVIFAAAIVVAIFIQNYKEKELDERVASAQDYSIVVWNPPRDADAPDEWKHFFSQFGTVRYVTVNRCNRLLLQLLLKKRLLMRRFPAKYYNHQEKSELDYQAINAASAPIKWHVKFLFVHFGYILTDVHEELLCLLNIINEQIEVECLKSHFVSSIFVTFEFEQEKQNCLHALVNEYSLINRLRGRINNSNRFRGKHLLIAEESSEPDNMAWLNSSLDDSDRRWRKALSFSWTGGILFICFLFVKFADSVSPLALLIVISGLDNILPMLFIAATDLEGNADEDDRQQSYMVKLFVGRLLCVVIFPLLFTDWITMLNVETIASIKNVQLSCCFLTPLLRLFDLFGIFKRHVLTRLFARNEADAFRYWSGTEFTLAERYTDIAKIMFISLFYSFLDPTALFYAALACLNSFLIDRYCLFRLSPPPAMLDNSMGPTIFKLLSWALVAKVVMSLYFAYSWRFDEIYVTSLGNYVKVDKTPTDSIWHMEQETWQTHLQWTAVSYYIRLLYAAIVFSFVICFFEGIKYVCLLLVGQGDEAVQCTNKQPYSVIPNITCYCPTVSYSPESFLAADISEMLPKHRPATVDLNDKENREFNFEVYLPSQYDSACLAKVKWYADAAHIPNEEGARATDFSSSALEIGKSQIASLIKNHENIRVSPVEKLPSKRSGARTQVVLAPMPQKERDHDIIKKIKRELSKSKNRLSTSATVEPVCEEKVKFERFVELLRGRFPQIIKDEPGSSSRGVNYENSLRAAFLNELLYQNIQRNENSDMIDFDAFLDHMTEESSNSHDPGRNHGRIIKIL